MTSTATAFRPAPSTPGDFYTPHAIAAAAHRYLLRTATSNGTSATLYDTHHFWDPFAGTGRLLEPFPLHMRGRLYASTLASEDVEELHALPLPERAHCFSYDFLNQPDTDIPCCLLDNLTPGSRWVFLLNPPFVGHRNLRGTGDRAEVDTATRAAMTGRKIGRASLNLTTQGLFRLWELVRTYDLDASVGVFSQASIWAGEGYSAFRGLWQSEAEFGFVDGFLFPAREFAGVTGEWPAAFTVWGRGRTPRALMLDVMDRGEIIGRKELRQPDQPLGKWVVRPRNVVPALQISSAVTVAKGKRTRRDKLAQDALGFVTWLGNDVRNSKGTCLLSAPGAQAGWSITPDNFLQSLVAAAARLLVKPIWLNDCDPFSAPNTSHPQYSQFAADAVVWLIGSMANHTASLEGVAYGGETHTVSNHFYWMTPAEMLAIKDLPEEVRAQCREAEERFLSCWLQGKAFSTDTQWIFDELKRLVAVTAAARPLADPALQLDRWDAGFWQIRRGLAWTSDYYTPPPTVLRRFRSYKRRHKRLGERLAALVYDLGMLPRPLVACDQPQIPVP